MQTSQHNARSDVQNVGMPLTQLSTLAVEFINFAQNKINLYLDCKDAASVQKLRDAMKIYSASNEFEPLMETLRELNQQQGQPAIEESRSRSKRLTREDLHLVCFEYICD